MDWAKEAEQALARVPFFVRGRVRRRVEEEARAAGADRVRLAHVEACKERYLRKMDGEVRGFEVEQCFGPNGCPNRAVADDGLAEELTALLAGRDLRAFLKERVQGPLKLHHQFRIVLADCPNACSRPQIADLGIIGALRPTVADPEACSECGACTETCAEEALRVEPGRGVGLLGERCLACGQCLAVCATGALAAARRGYRILVGGRLGRHPQLARELPRLYDRSEVPAVVAACLDHYQRHNRRGERFGDILQRVGAPDGAWFAPEKKGSS